MDLNGKCGTDGRPARGVAKALSDIMLFLVLFLLVYGVAEVSVYNFLHLEQGTLGDEVLYVRMLMEALMLLAILASVWVVLRIRRIPMHRYGLCWIQGRGQLGWGALLALLLYAVGFGLSLAAGAVQVVDASFRFTALFLSLMLFLRWRWPKR